MPKLCGNCMYCVFAEVESNQSKYNCVHPQNDYIIEDINPKKVACPLIVEEDKNSPKKYRVGEIIKFIITANSNNGKDNIPIPQIEIIDYLGMEIVDSEPHTKREKFLLKDGRFLYSYKISKTLDQWETIEER